MLPLSEIMAPCTTSPIEQSGSPGHVRTGDTIGPSNRDSREEEVSIMPSSKYHVTYIYESMKKVFRFFSLSQTENPPSVVGNKSNKGDEEM